MTEDAIAAVEAVLDHPISAVAAACSCTTCARRLVEELAKKGWTLVKVEEK
ncbi:MAG: hypothetical protein KGL39_04095 [Patescibacteria group bacterium]|nr:hypothetical protein [Patescibacteria group bacterium]